jgi:putative hydrolase
MGGYFPDLAFAQASQQEMFGYKRAATDRGVAIEIDGDPARQELDYELARQALTIGSLFALDTDAHIAAQLSYAETALTHARLAAIPVDRIVNCWPLDRLLAWLSSECRR